MHTDDSSTELYYRMYTDLCMITLYKYDITKYRAAGNPSIDSLRKDLINVMNKVPEDVASRAMNTLELIANVPEDNSKDFFLSSVLNETGRLMVYYKTKLEYEQNLLS